MTHVLLLLVCLLAGTALRGSGRLPEGGHTALNAVVINVGLPAFTLAQLGDVHWSRDMLLPVALPWLMFGLGFVVFVTAGRIMRLEPGTTGALMLCGGLANTSFVGLPMIAAFYGSEHLATGMVMDQLGTYLILNTLGVAVALAYGRQARHEPLGQAARRALHVLSSYPPFLALLATVVLLPFGLPPPVSELARSLGSIVVPLALMSVGAQLRLGSASDVARPLALGLAFKLIAAPLALLGGSVALGLHGRSLEVGLFETAMGPQIGASIVALQHGLDRRVITAMVAFGLLLSFLTVPGWRVALGFLFQ